MRLSQDFGKSEDASSSSIVSAIDEERSSGSFFVSSDVSSLMIVLLGIVKRSVSGGMSVVTMMPLPAPRSRRSTISKAG